ncbi:MAG TPA: hypothetical protein VMU50_10580 [Polyangia bacterium]|nr:hypothetical protein [Polyangia bacterium]
MATSAARSVRAVLAAWVLASAACNGNAGLVPDAGGASDDGVTDGGSPSGTWRELAPVPHPRFFNGVAAAGGKLYLVGGTVPATFDSSPERYMVTAYDPKTDTWTDLPTLPIPVIQPNVAGVGDRLFVMGSIDSNQTFVFDTATQDWVEKTPFPINAGRGAAAVGVDGTTVYLAGGVIRGLSANALDTGVRQPNLMAYDTTADSWRMLANLPVAVGYATGAIVDGLFWVMGGSTNNERTDQVMTFDLTSGQWSTKGPLPADISSAGAGVIGGRIFIVAGVMGAVATFHAQAISMDPSIGTWTALAPMPMPRFAMGAGVIDGTIYVPSGLGPVDTPDMFAVSPSLESFTP